MLNGGALAVMISWSQNRPVDALPDGCATSEELAAAAGKNER